MVAWAETAIHLVFYNGAPKAFCAGDIGTE